MKTIKTLFERNLFERIILYLLFADLVVKIIFELILGESSLAQSQNRQWVFYGLLLMDYAVCFPKLIRLRISVNPLSLFSLFIMIIIVQGLFVGVFNHNPAFEILNDTIPLLMVSLNILRMQSVTEYSKPIDFQFIFNIVILIATASCLIGFLGNSLGQPTTAIIPLTPFTLPALFAGFFTIRPFPRFAALLFGLMIILSISEINRTTMAFMFFTAGSFAVFQTVKNPAKGLMIFVAFSLILAMTWMIVPENSKTYRRIIGITEIDLQSRKGSIGERTAEFDSINNTLAKKGKTHEWVGLGFGGLYEFQSTHDYIRDYGHAHYAWAWFKLRFGYLGYLYLTVLFSLLCYNIFRGLQDQSKQGIFIALLGIQGILYLATFVNAIFLCSGIHFFRLTNSKNPIEDKDSSASRT